MVFIFQKKKKKITIYAHNGQLAVIHFTSIYCTSNEQEQNIAHDSATLLCACAYCILSRLKDGLTFSFLKTKLHELQLVVEDGQFLWSYNDT